MGACLSSGGVIVSREHTDRSLHAEAEKSLQETKRRLDKQVKVLLLGCGDAGKSTVLKQMRLVCGVPFSPEEIKSCRQLVFNNLIHGLTRVIAAMADMDLEVSPENSHLVAKVENAPDVKDTEPFPRDYLEVLRRLWEDPQIQAAYARGNEAALPENLLYFFAHLERLFDPAYSPSQSDILHTRARTVGVTEETFPRRKHEMLMIEVGGQKGKRRKWIHCFEDVVTILFVASLSGFDRCLVDDKDMNQMKESLALWDSICQSPWFRHTPMIVLLNKSDLFERSVQRSDIGEYFPDYDGEPGDAAAGRQYFRNRFASIHCKYTYAPARYLYIQYAVLPPLSCSLRVRALPVAGATY